MPACHHNASLRYLHPSVNGCFWIAIFHVSIAFGLISQNTTVQVGNQATVLGFVGAPFSIATYIIEGGTTKYYQKVKDVIYTQPELLKQMCSMLADSLADYIRYQVWPSPGIAKIHSIVITHSRPISCACFVCASLLYVECASPALSLRFLYCISLLVLYVEWWCFD